MEAENNKPRFIKNQNSFPGWGRLGWGDKILTFVVPSLAYSKSNKLKDKILDSMRGYIFINVNTLGFDMPTDYQLMKDWYKVTRPAFFITYPQPINTELINLALKSKNNN